MTNKKKLHDNQLRYGSVWIIVQKSNKIQATNCLFFFFNFFAILQTSFFPFQTILNNSITYPPPPAHSSPYHSKYPFKKKLQLLGAR